QIISSLHQQFSMTDLSSLNYFVGIFVTCKYAVEILEQAHMVNCNPSRTPIDTESKMGKDEPHLSAIKRILRYVQGTLDHGSQLFLSFTTSSVAYSDADWAGYQTTRRSTSEAEYHGVANAVTETC
nr:ribonuclease H-like domain-containing protein [Tanacetum cinerariifolium]